MRIIARVHTDFPTKFGLPRQSGLAPALLGTVVMEPEFRNADAFRGLEGFSHIWLLWEFSESLRQGWSATARPPRLGGNARMGVFATRSPFRPNPIGLSCVRLERVETHPTQGPVLHISGVDCMDGTPVYDIKPYLPYADCHPEASGGFAETVRGYALEVRFPEPLLERVPEQARAGLLQALAEDPRPSYQEDPLRRYGMAYAGCDIRFFVEGDVLTVADVVPNATAR